MCMVVTGSVRLHLSQCGPSATPSVPRLILPSVRVNMDAGRWLPAKGNGVCYLQVPLNVL